MIFKSLSESYYKYVYECQQMSLSSLWHFLGEEFPSFDDRKEAFFMMLERALTEQHIKLIKNNNYLLGTPQDQVELFRKAFPDRLVPDENFPNEDASYWFYYPECPGEAVWRVERPNGITEWIHTP